MATKTQPLIPVADLATLINSLAGQHIGSSVVVDNDLSNLADFGAQYENLDSATKQIVTSGMITLVTEQLFVTREYKGNGLDIIRSRTSYDAADGIIQKNRPALPQAVSDEEVYDPAPGSSSDPFKNYPINFETEYFSKPFAYRYQWSKPERWITGMFLSREAFIQAIASISTMVDNALALNIENVTMAAVRASMVLNLSGVTDLGGVGNNRAVNLLAEYNSAYATTLSAAAAMQTPEFLRFATHRMFMTLDYLKAYTSMYNERSYPTFTNEANAHFVMLAQFKRASEQFLQSDTFHNEFVQLPKHDTVPAWKGFLLDAKGTPSFKSTSTVKDTISVSWEEEPLSVDTSGVIGTIFDTERVGVHNLAVTNTNQKDPVGLKTNYWTHVFGKSITDPYANAVTFYVRDAA